MFSMSVHRCPGCGTENGADGVALAINADVGAEVWGQCWSCGADFGIAAPTRVSRPTSDVLRSYRSPTVSPYAFPMWNPLPGARPGGHR